MENVTTLPVRFLTPEIEAADRAAREGRRLEKRRHRLAEAIQEDLFARCHHGRGCLHCVADFILRGNVGPAVDAIDAALAAEPAPPMFQLGQWWRVLIGELLISRLAEIDAAGYDWTKRYELPEAVPEAPEANLMITGVTLDGRALLAPVDMVMMRSKRGPQVTLAADYLLRHGVRCS